jgi:predicted esterase
MLMTALKSYVCAIAALCPALLAAQDDVADIPSQDLRVGDDAKKRYFLIGPTQGAEAPADGFGLIIVLPGGNGSAEFNPFVKRIYKHAVPDGYLVAQPVAPQWGRTQEITWPTAKNRVPRMKFSTEEFVTALVDDVATKHKLDPSRIFTLGWSSGGPAAYAASLADGTKVTGSFAAMSVFNPRYLPPLANAKGKAFYLHHSPDDQVCPFRMAEKAAADLKTNGATVELHTYAGGHGWQGNLYDDIRTGIEWLEGNRSNKGT